MEEQDVQPAQCSTCRYVGVEYTRLCGFPFLVCKHALSRGVAVRRDHYCRYYEQAERAKGENDA